MRAQKKGVRDDDGEEQKGSDSSEDSGEDSDEVEDQEAHRIAMQFMLSGEHPDTEIDRLLESFGVQVSQIGTIPINNFFKGQ